MKCLPLLEGNEERVDRSSGHYPTDVPPQRDMAWGAGVGGEASPLAAAKLAREVPNTSRGLGMPVLQVVHRVCERQAKYTPRKEIQQVLSITDSAPSSRPCTGNTGINSYSRWPKKATFWDKTPPLSSLWALKSFIVWIFNYCRGSVANLFPWSHFPLTWIRSRHYAEFRGPRKLGKQVCMELTFHDQDKSAFGEHPKVGSTPPEALYDLKVPLLYDPSLTLLASILWSQLPASNARLSLGIPLLQEAFPDPLSRLGFVALC